MSASSLPPAAGLGSCQFVSAPGAAAGGRATVRSAAAIPQAFACRSTTLGSPYSTGRHSARTAGSSAAFMLISGPIPAGSPVAMAMMGSVSVMRDHIRLHRTHKRLSRRPPFRAAFDLQQCRRTAKVRYDGEDKMDDLVPVLEDLI